MRAYISFVKKEFVEYLRTYKLLIVFSVFLLFGMLNPITARIMPDLLSSLMPEGISVTIADPVPLDSWIQFYKNMSGMQIIVFIIVFSGIMAHEISGGTLINMLTKGLSRRTVILSKFTAVVLVWTLSYALCFGITYGYTVYLLPGELPNLLFAGMCMWLFGILLLSVMLFGSVLFSNFYGSLLVTGFAAVFLMLLSFVPNLQRFNPYRLASDPIALLTDTAAPSDLRIPILLCCLLALLPLAGSLLLFDRKKI